MASKTIPDFVDRVRSSVDIVALISESVPLKRAGRKHKGLCPFHNEKTPSFHVDDSKGLFYCFGCQVGGDAFKFVMLRENVEFIEAARIIARQLGIPVTESRPGRQSERESMLAAHEAAARFYHDVLVKQPEGQRARDYLRSRGISDETVDRLGIGFAPDGWDALKGHLASKGLSTSLLVTAGLLSKNERTGSTYDRFRSRVMFPIRNLSGIVIAFGGRIVGPGEPKYLNTSETPLYNKREHLYGLDVTRNGIRDAGEAVVVEGYTDLASLLQAGVPHVVATLGTAFSDGQITLLRRFTDRVVINYDPDTAGAAATRRSIDLLVGSGFKVRILDLERGADPDEFVRKNGLQAYRDLLDKAPRYFDYLLDKATEGRNLSSFEDKSACLKQILPAVARVPDRIERSGYVNALADRLGIDDEITLAEIRDAMVKDSPGKRTGIPVSPTRSAITETEGRLVRALLESPDIRSEVLPSLSPEDLEGSAIESMVRAIDSLQRSGETVTFARLSEVLADSDRSSLAGLAVGADMDITIEEALSCAEALKLRRLRKVRESLQKQMNEERDTARLEDLMRRKMEVSRRIDALS